MFAFLFVGRRNSACFGYCAVSHSAKISEPYYPPFKFNNCLSAAELPYPNCPPKWRFMCPPYPVVALLKMRCWVRPNLTCLATRSLIRLSPNRLPKKKQRTSARPDFFSIICIFYTIYSIVISHSTTLCALLAAVNSTEAVQQG